MIEEQIFVVVPVYKVEPYLRRCIDSILNQTLAEFRLILVDDGSPDNCPAICDEYAEKDSRIHVIHQENGGLSAARNAGIDYAFAHGDPDTDWISFIDSDDFVHPRYLEYLYRAVKETDAEVSCCAYIRTSGSEIADAEAPFSCTSLAPEQFWQKDRTNATVAWGKMYRLRGFKEVCYPVWKVHEDEFTTYRIIFQYPKMAIVKAVLYCYYSNNSGITHSQWTPRRLDVLNALEAQMAYFRENGFPVAYRYSARDFLQHSIKHVMYIKHLSPQYDHLLPDVKRRKRRAFRLYAETVGWKNAFSYWYQVRIKSPMERVLGKESVFSFLKRRIKKKLHL